MKIDTTDYDVDKAHALTTFIHNTPTRTDQTQSVKGNTSHTSQPLHSGSHQLDGNFHLCIEYDLLYTQFYRNGV